MKQFFQKGLGALASKQTNIFSAAFFIILTTIFSQVLGLFKYRILVGFFGASNDLGVFFAAFRIPDFIFQVVIAGALSTSFIPVFSEYIQQDKRKQADNFTSSLLTLGIIFYIAVTIIVVLFSYQLCELVAPGFTTDELRLMAQFMVIIQLAQLFFILGTVATAVLQSLQHFLIPGIATAFYNLGIIVGLLLFVPFVGIYAATIGVFIGSALFFLVQLPLLLHSDYFYKPTLDLSNGVMKIVRLMVPRSITLIITQLAITANVFFASFLGARSLVIFDLAQTLVLAPVVLFGQSIAQASFPTLSQKKDDKKTFDAVFVSSFNQILYLTLPLSALFMVLRIPLIRLFFGASRFDWLATVDTGRTLAYFSVSIAAQSLIYLLARGFYAHKDTRTPMIVTVATVVINIVLSYVFVLVFKLPIFFLAAAFSIANILAALLMFFLLDRKIGLPKTEIFLTTIKIAVATLIMGIALYIPIKLLDQLVFDTTKTINLLLLTGIASFVGLVTYIFFTWIFDISEARYIIEVAKRVKSGKFQLKEMGEMIDGTKTNL
ncbi:MAG: murein biosynthesis integral membrane protein MurJ [Candidatus Levyibacteriota bacterium]